jgi:hypothetical protein
MSDTQNGITLAARATDLANLRAVLEDQRARAIDLVMTPGHYAADGGSIVITGAEQVLEENGITDPNGRYAPTRVAIDGLAEKLGIHASYLRRIAADRPDLFDLNVNGLLHGTPGPQGPDGAPYPPLAAKLMLRLLRGDQSGTGVLRAVLSNSYQRIDNLDVLVAALGGVRDAGVAGRVTRCDLTETRMVVVIEAPEIRAQAPGLLAGYRDPFGRGGVERIRQLAQREGLGYEPGTEPVMHAGIKISNSETGDGRFTVSPHLTVQICRNGYTVKMDALGATHLGGKLEEGLVRWSAATQRKALELVASKSQDAVGQFLSGEYLERKVAEWAEQAGTPVKAPAETITAMVRASAIPNAYADEILNCFIAGGQLTAGGVMHAVTAAAQTVQDGDLADLMEQESVGALAYAAGNAERIAARAAAHAS